MNSTFYGTASITDAKRTQVINNNCSPGPAGYDPRNDDQQRIPLWTLKPKINHGACFHNPNKTPGVGAYHLPKQLNIAEKNPTNQPRPHKQKMYVDKSNHMSDINIPSSIPTQKGYKFGYRDEVVVRETSPGPIYHVDDKVNDGRKNKTQNRHGLGFGKRSQISNDAKSFPGPGSYSHQTNQRKGQKWGFSKSSKKQNNKHMNPLGPGDYDPKVSSTGRGCKLKGRYPEEKRDVFNTGPGSYEIPDTKTKKGTKFANNKNSGLFVKSQYPSPFSYAPTETTFKKGGYSLGKKLNDDSKEECDPGPGTYELRDQVYEIGPGGYMGRKISSKKKEKDSNFYKYNPKYETVNYESPKFTFKKNEYLENEDKINRLGPGSYLNLKKGLSESYTIPKDQRFKPLVKQKIINTKVNENAYSTVGFLPAYLKKKEKKKERIQVNKIQKQNIE